MSIKALDAAWDLPPVATDRGSISLAAKLLLLALADYADDVGRSWPKQETLAQRTGMNRKTVVETLDLLERRGLIGRVRRNRDDGSRRSDLIYLLFLRLPAHIQEDAPRPQDVEPLLPQVTEAIVTSAPEPLLPQVTARTVSIEPSGATLPVGPSGPTARGGGPASPWEKDRLFGELWETATPTMRTRAKSKANAWAAWVKARGVADPEAIIKALVRYKAGDPDVARTGGRGLHLWLRDRTFDSWAEGVAAGVPEAPTFAGPPELRKALVDSAGEAFVRSYLDPAKWDEDGRAILPRTLTAHTKLQQVCGSILRSYGAKVAMPR